MSNVITRDPGAPELPASGDLDHDRILGAVERLAEVRPWTALGFLAAERDRAWVAVVEPLAGRARAARKRTARQLVELAGDGPPDARGDGRAIVTTIEPQLAALWELARQHLSGADGRPLEDVARSASFRIPSPYLSRGEALRHALATTVEPVAPYVGATVVDGDSAR